jgi:MFS family permease
MHVEQDPIVSRDHSWRTAVFISFSLSLCITVDILQYSMPLAFLPSVLEDRGHSPMKIATAIGVYYWTGFLGGCILTGYQIWRLVTDGAGKSEEDAVVSVRAAKRQMWYLIFGLLLGGATLACQAASPRYNVHTACRFIQGFAGAFLFFYTFLLSAQLFKGSQKTFAMSAASTALNVAEVLGSMIGALVFHYYGQRMVFVILGAASLLNVCVLVAAQFLLVPATPEEEDGEAGATISGSALADPSADGWERLRALLKGKHLGCAVILIATAAVVKGSVEEMLPFHADHRWHADPLVIGYFFAIIAICYIIAAVATGRFWEALGSYRIYFGAFWLGCLGLVAYGAFHVASWRDADVRYFYAFLVLYGICLGTTHTPAALLLGDAIERESGAGKDAANGVWNTMWEAGGSLGFLLGGVLAHNYAGQLDLLFFYSGLCVVAAAGLAALGGSLYSAAPELLKLDAQKRKLQYDSVH